MLRILILSAVLLAFSCKSTKRPPANEVPIIMMEKTTCMGPCPAFKFEVYLDNSAKYMGKAHVDNIGEFSATLTDKQLDYLENSFAEAGYFSFANVYSAAMSDLPTTYIYYNNGEQGLKITDYYGAPQELKDLEKLIEEFIGTIEWKKN
jgi:hypothetical protein